MLSGDQVIAAARAAYAPDVPLSVFDLDDTPEVRALIKSIQDDHPGEPQELPGEFPDPGNADHLYSKDGSAAALAASVYDDVKPEGKVDATMLEAERFLAGVDDPSLVESKRLYIRDDHGRFANVHEGGGSSYAERIGSNRHGSGYLEASDHALIGRHLNSVTARQVYNEAYDQGVAARDGAQTPKVLGDKHASMNQNMAALRRVGREQNIEGGSRAESVLQDAGYIDGALGTKRRYRRTLTDPSTPGTVLEYIGGSIFGGLLGKDEYDLLTAEEKREYVRDDNGQFARVPGHGEPPPFDPAGKTGFEHYDDGVLSWWVKTMDNGGSPIWGPSTTPSDVEKRVRAEYAKRQPGRLHAIGTQARGAGATMDPRTWSEPTDGYIVAVQGHNKEIPEDEFFADRAKIIADYLKEQRRNMAAGPANQPRMLGLWHDVEHREVVLDIVEQHHDREAAIQAGRDRNQQAIWDVANAEEIDTGGTGDRSAKSLAPGGGVLSTALGADPAVRFHDVGVMAAKTQAAAPRDGANVTPGAVHAAGNGFKVGQADAVSDEAEMVDLESVRKWAVGLGPDPDMDVASPPVGREAGVPVMLKSSGPDQAWTEFGGMSANIPDTRVRLESGASSNSNEASSSALGSHGAIVSTPGGTGDRAAEGKAGRPDPASGPDTDVGRGDRRLRAGGGGSLSADPAAFLLSEEKREYVRDKDGQFARVPTHSGMRVGDTVNDALAQSKLHEDPTQMRNLPKDLRAAMREEARRMGATPASLEREIQATLDRAIARTGNPPRGHDWYEQANGELQRAAAHAGISSDAMIGATAASSPQMAWAPNLAVAQYIAENRNAPVHTDILRQVVTRRIKIKGKDTKVTKTNYEFAQDEINGAHGKGRKMDGTVRHMPSLDELEGATFDELDPYVASAIMKTHAQAGAGVFNGVDLGGKPLAVKDDITGKSQRVNFTNNTSGGRALRIIRGEDPNLILNGHKVRSFYNNLSDPTAINGDVTVDSHAVSLALGRKVSSSSTEYKAFASKPANATIGLRGSYPLWADAYRRVAARNGMRVNQLQSITWIQWRYEHPDNAKIAHAMD
jgi:hypothetical protein